MNGHAGATLTAAVTAALREVGSLSGVHEALPVQAAPPYATIETGIEVDWSHKSGLGREIRLTITLRDQGERPSRLRGLAEEVAATLDGIGPALDGWRLVTLNFVRSMIVAESAGRWVMTLDYRARMLAG